MLADQVLAAASDQPPQHQRDDDDVVELACDRYEVGYEVERHRQVARERHEHELVATRQARVTHQPRAENDAIGDEPGQRARLLAAPRREEDADEERVEESESAEE